MTCKPPSHECFASRFDAGDYTIILDRKGLGDRALEVRVEMKPSAAAIIMAAGFVIYLERGESLIYAAKKIATYLERICLRPPPAEALITFQDVTTHWLMFNFAD